MIGTLNSGWPASSADPVAANERQSSLPAAFSTCAERRIVIVQCPRRASTRDQNDRHMSPPPETLPMTSSYSAAPSVQLRVIGWCVGQLLLRAIKVSGRPSDRSAISPSGSTSPSQPAAVIALGRSPPSRHTRVRSVSSAGGGTPAAMPSASAAESARRKASIGMETGSRSSSCRLVARSAGSPLRTEAHAIPLPGSIRRSPRRPLPRLAAAPSGSGCRPRRGARRDTVRDEARICSSARQ